MVPPVQLIESIIVPGDTDVVTFLGLDGDLDEYYIIRGQILAGNAGDNLHLRVNGSDANMVSAVEVNTGSALDPVNTAFAYLGELSSIGTTTVFVAELFADKTPGLVRGGKSVSSRGVGVVNQGSKSEISYNDNASKVVSLDVYADGGSGVGIKAGSLISLWKWKN